MDPQSDGNWFCSFKGYLLFYRVFWFWKVYDATEKYCKFMIKLQQYFVTNFASVCCWQWKVKKKKKSTLSACMLFHSTSTSPISKLSMLAFAAEVHFYTNFPSQSELDSIRYKSDYILAEHFCSDIKKNRQNKRKEGGRTTCSTSRTKVVLIHVNFCRSFFHQLVVNDRERPWLR